AVRAAARFSNQRFLCAYEGAHETAIDFRRQRVSIQTGTRKEGRRVFRTIDARRLDVDGVESCPGENALVFLFLEGACNASHPELHVASNVGRSFTAYYHIGNRKSTARFEN